MSASARLAVRLMDRTRRIDELEMKTLAHDPALLVLEASATAMRIARQLEGAPDEETIARAAIGLAYEQALEDGFSVRTALLDEGWLLLVRIDQRTGAAILHPQPCDGMLLAA
jgi:hypothetical protein